jgi:molecular chaperone IbpA|tara:strand:+ start:176 stop:598 length:423 start_codon:yes stop_codon:yes gene_type:complete
MNDITFLNRLRPFTIGFDDVFNTFETLSTSNNFSSTYPPYDIVKIDDYKYNVELAVAGFSKNDIQVDYADNTLTIESKKEKETEDENFIHKGISKRYFKKSFTIADDVIVNGAGLKDGLLTIELEKILPEGKKPKTIEIK